MTKPTAARHGRPRKQPDRCQPNRRQFLALGAGLSAICAAPLFNRAYATTSLQSGDMKLTLLSDGHLTLPESMFAPRQTASARKAALSQAGQHGAQVKSPLTVTLIERGDQKILIDVGSGTRFMDGAGKLGDALDEQGIDRETITHVVFTHAHPDHLWGVIDDFDEISFPNASYMISEQEWNFWMSKDILTKLPKERHGFAVGAQRNLKAVHDKLSMIKPGQELLPGILAIDTAGHTPGHISLEVGRGKDNFVILGDALTHPIISFQHPDWQPASDHVPDLAAATRKRLLDKLATDSNRIVGYHLPPPGPGRVRRTGTAYEYVSSTQ